VFSCHCDTANYLCFHAVAGESIPGVMTCSHDSATGMFVEMLQRERLGGDACQFHAFRCPNETAWQRGECFSCGQGVESSPTDGACAQPGLQLFSKLVPQKLKDTRYFFNTQPKQDKTGNFCGDDARSIFLVKYCTWFSSFNLI